MLVGSMRVSSDNDRQTTHLQRDALLAAGVDPRHLFAEKASGARDDRPGLQQALAAASHAYCHHLTGVGRGFSLPDRADGPLHGAFLFSVFGVLAQYERALTQERIRAGLEAARRRGKRGADPGRSVLNNWTQSARPCRRVPAKPLSAGPLK
jgi:DNA invertase Pin-like site-specific DNA recombinase